MYDMKKTKRINARLTVQTAKRLVELARDMGSNMSEVITKSIESYYFRATPERKNPFKIFQEVGFLGCGKADPDLSIKYKSYLTKSLEKKI